MKVSELLQKALALIEDGKEYYTCHAMKNVLSKALGVNYWSIGYENPDFEAAVRMLYAFRTEKSALMKPSHAFFRTPEERLKGIEKAIRAAEAQELKVSYVLKAAMVLIENDKQDFGCHAVAKIIGPKKKSTPITYRSAQNKPLFISAKYYLGKFRTLPMGCVYFKNKTERLEGFRKAIALAESEGH
jgi:hypothetical protein